MRRLVLLVVLGGCYTGARATRDVNAAWRGHSRAELEARWGTPSVVEGDALVWTTDHRHVELPSGEASLHVEPGAFDAHAELRPGSVTEWQTHVVARVDGAGRILSVEGATLRYGPPRGTNLRWGVLLGLHAGMGALDDTGTPLPSGGVYLGGMLGPRHGLVGTYDFVSGKGDGGGAIGMAAGVALQWWPLARLWLRAGPAGVLSWDPGFEDVSPTVGVTTGASYALIRGRTFVLDARIAVIGAPDVVFGSVGLGVNVN